MELGGNAPVLVCADADVELAAKTVAAVKFANSGQICVTPNRVYVHESHYDRFLDLMVGYAKATVVGHGRESGATMGPLSSAAARRRDRLRGSMPARGLNRGDAGEGLLLSGDHSCGCER